MKPTGGSVAAFIAQVRGIKRRRDAETLLEVFHEETGMEPELWGTIIGFGACSYTYPTGNTGDMPIAAFAPRTAACVLYLLQPESCAELLAKLGPHRASKGCVYINDVSLLDLSVLRELIRLTVQQVRANELPGVDLTITKDV